jgi:hypothetical protein
MWQFIGSLGRPRVPRPKIVHIGRLIGNLFTYLLNFSYLPSVGRFRFSR